MQKTTWVDAVRNGYIHSMPQSEKIENELRQQAAELFLKRAEAYESEKKFLYADLLKKLANEIRNKK